MEAQSIFYIETEKIKPNPFQPRREFDPNNLEELANSIKEYGILEPLLAVRAEKYTESGTEVEYQLLAGERRLRAAKLVGLNTVPVIIKENIADREKLEIALIENLQREDINSIERAKAFAELADKFKLSQREIAFRVGKSREFVANTLRLLQLPQEIQRALENGKVSEGHARIILSLNLPEQQKALLGRIISYNLTVRQAEESAKQLKKQAQYSAGSYEQIIPNFDPELEELESLLEETLKTRVILKKKGRKGMIAINFNSQEELENIIEKIIGSEAGAPEITELQTNKRNEANQTKPSFETGADFFKPAGANYQSLESANQPESIPIPQPPTPPDSQIQENNFFPV
ncbi:MAG: ParB/RepB/Spo0J family partition protein [Patescibacteria group bacterium]